MVYSDFAVDLVVKQMAEIWNKKSTPKKLSSVLLQAIEIIQQLRRKAAPPPNAPLTLEELREMDGEPVWVVGANDEDVNGNGYAVVHIWHEEFARVSRPGDADEPEPLIENYGKTWLAYRRKPEEGLI